MSDVCLLDTHVLLWAVVEPHRLPSHTRDLIANNRYTVSVASFWELVNKQHHSSSPVRNPSLWWEHYVVRLKTTVLPIRSAHVSRLEELPLLHKDPFDRILMAQSITENLPLLTADRSILSYPHPVNARSL